MTPIPKPLIQDSSGQLSHSWDAEGALRALEDGIAVLSNGERVVFANPALGELLGRPGAEPEGLELGKLALWEHGLADALRGQTPPPFKMNGLHTAHSSRQNPSGARVVEFRLSPLGAGTALLRARDVTQLDRAERAASSNIEENESLRVVACLLAEETDVDQVLLLLSAQAASQCQADGATVIEVEGELGRAVASVGTLRPVQGREFQVAGSLAEVAVRSRAPVAVDDYLAKYGSHSWADVARETGAGPVLLAPMFAHDTVLGVVTVVRSSTRPAFGETEIRRIRALADQAALAIWKSRLLAGAQAANEAKNEFIAVMSHELRTPLAAVAGYEELLADEILGPLNDEQHNAIDRMRWGTQLLASIIEEILTYSRLESGEMSVRMEDVSVDAVLRSAAAVLQPLAAARELELRVVAPDSELRLRTDAAILRRVLVNLGSNAIKFTREGEIELSVTRDGPIFKFSVRDTGIGIAPDDMKRIFDAFTQIHTGIARPYGGSGLGLHTANRLVRLLGGELTAESRLDAGSTFSVLLPSGD